MRPLCQNCPRPNHEAATRGGFLAIFAILGLLLCPRPINAQDSVVSADFEYGQVGEKALLGYLARPNAAGEYPAIILIHEWWGLNDAIRQTARDFANQGYVALAVDLYGEEATTDRELARKYATQVQQDMEGAFENLKAAVSSLQAMEHVDAERMASIGWCFGGGWSYQMAKNNLGVKATVIYYGRFNPKDDLKIMRAKIIGHFAEEDRGISIDNVNEFQATLKSLSGEHEIYIYPNTQHGFASRPGENPKYDEQAAKLAWERTLAFLERTLKTPVAQ